MHFQIIRFESVFFLTPRLQNWNISLPPPPDLGHKNSIQQQVYEFMECRAPVLSPEPHARARLGPGAAAHPPPALSSSERTSSDKQKVTNCCPRSTRLRFDPWSSLMVICLSHNLMILSNFNYFCINVPYIFCEKRMKCINKGLLIYLGIINGFHTT